MVRLLRESTNRDSRCQEGKHVVLCTTWYYMVLFCRRHGRLLVHQLWQLPAQQSGQSGEVLLAGSTNLIASILALRPSLCGNAPGKLTCVHGCVAVVPSDTA
jgi:hypothetical protein